MLVCSVKFRYFLIILTYIMIANMINLTTLSHYNVLVIFCQPMEMLSCSLTYAVIEFKKSEKASTGKYTNRMLNELNEYEAYV